MSLGLAIVLFTICSMSWPAFDDAESPNQSDGVSSESAGPVGPIVPLHWKFSDDESGSSHSDIEVPVQNTLDRSPNIISRALLKAPKHKRGQYGPRFLTQYRNDAAAKAKAAIAPRFASQADRCAFARGCKKPKTSQPSEDVTLDGTSVSLSLLRPFCDPCQIITTHFRQPAHKPGSQSQKIIAKVLEFVNHYL